MILSTENVDPRVARITAQSVEDWNAWMVHGRTNDSAEVYAWARLQEVRIAGADLSGRILAGGLFDGAQIENTTFRRANLRGAHFARAALVRADFRHASLYGVDFNGATLSDVDFRWARLYACNFDRASLRNGSFFGADLCVGTLANLGCGSLWLRYLRYRRGASRRGQPNPASRR